MRSRGRILDAEQFLEIGRGVVPDDPVVLYESGLLQEMFATQWRRGARHRDAPGRAVACRDPLDDVLTNRPVRLDKAEQWLRASLRSDASNVMARLHLGRVQMMRRANDEALELLRGVVESTARPCHGIPCGDVHGSAARTRRPARRGRPGVSAGDREIRGGPQRLSRAQRGASARGPGRRVAGGARQACSPRIRTRGGSPGRGISSSRPRSRESAWSRCAGRAGSEDGAGGPRDGVRVRGARPANVPKRGRCCRRGCARHGRQTPGRRADRVRFRVARQRGRAADR